MGWWGKTICTGVGAVLLGPLGAGIGYAVGSALDSVPGETSSEEQLQLAISIRFFACLAKIAKADGRVSKEEIEVIEIIMDEYLELNEEDRKLAIEIFKEAKNYGATFEELIDQFAILIEYDLETSSTFLSFLHEVSIADGSISIHEMQMLSYAEHSLRVMPGTLAHMLSQFSNVDTAYQLLGCDSTMTDAQIKSAYRKKCIQFHPDKLSGSNLAPEFIEFANSKLVEINQAYEQISASRCSVGV